MQRKFLILFIKYAKRGDLIHCTPDKTKKQSAGAERNFSGDSPWVINDKSEAQADLVIIIDISTVYDAIGKKEVSNFSLPLSYRY